MSLIATDASVGNKVQFSGAVGERGSGRRPLGRIFGAQTGIPKDTPRTPRRYSHGCLGGTREVARRHPLNTPRDRVRGEDQECVGWLEAGCRWGGAWCANTAAH